MPRLMAREDVIRTAAHLGYAEEVWSDEYHTTSGDIGLHLPTGGAYRVIVLKLAQDTMESSRPKGGIKIGLMKGVWTAPSDKEDSMMDGELASEFDVDGGI